ncbi:MAG: alanine dehydrogenase [Armatimonadota bacterium]
MQVGIPKETVPNEARVGMVPDGVRSLTQKGHQVIVQASAGEGSGFDDVAYEEAGAIIARDARDVYEAADLVVKVKQPEPPEWTLLREGQVVFGFLLAATRPEMTSALLERAVVGICCERMRDPAGNAPILRPMSEIAGKMAVFIGAQYLRATHGGMGICLARMTGVPPPHVLIFGGGTVGTHAASLCSAVGCRVTLLEADAERLNRLRRRLPGVEVRPSTRCNVVAALPEADLVINGIMWDPVARPRLITRGMLREMRDGSVIVDVSCDEAGAIETTRERTLADPTFVVDGVVHYCVPNIPSSVPRTATLALTNATLPFIEALAERGIRAAVRDDPTLASGVCFWEGDITDERIANAQGREYVALKDALAGRA